MLQQGAPRRGDDAARLRWEKRLDADVPGAQANAEEFTKQFMSTMYGEKQTYEVKQQQVTTVVTTKQQQQQQQQQQLQQRPAVASPPQATTTPPPTLPPKTKIMFSPSRDVFSPTQEVRNLDSSCCKHYIMSIISFRLNKTCKFNNSNSIITTKNMFTNQKKHNHKSQH